jgi:hypothetical protein
MDLGYFRVSCCAIVTVCLSVLPATNGFPQTSEVKVPAGTLVYLATTETLVGKKNQVRVGQIVSCTVWKDVIVNGRVVIEAGASALARVDSLKTAKVAGIKGKMSVAALEVNGLDDNPISLTGGYNKEGKGRIALSATLAGLIFLPLIFIPGGAVELPSGTVFDAYTRQSFSVAVAEIKRGRVIDLSHAMSDFDVEILYDNLEAVEKPKNFDFLISAPADAPEDFVIDRINGTEIEPIKMKTTSVERDDDTLTVQSTVKIKTLAKQFSKGINTIEVAYEKDEERFSQELIIEIQF